MNCAGKELMMEAGASFRPVDIVEFVRFVGTGVLATIGNLGAVYITARVASYAVALVVGLAVGLVLSFTLTKLIAFQSKSWTRAPGELVRFLIVYGVGALICWLVGYVTGQYLLPGYLERWQAEIGGAMVGASTMTLTSYFGHRFFTYRTFRPRPSS